MWFVFVLLFGLVSGSTFLLGNEGWTIIGNKKIEEATHMKYNWGGLNNFIIGTDNLINVDSKNRDDKNLWYFKSPLITLRKQPFGMSFSITSFSGDFTKLNRGFPHIVKITNNDDLVISFNMVTFNGNITHINVPFIKEIWNYNRDFSFKCVFDKPFSIEILGDWTQRSETIGIDNIVFF